MKFTLAPLALLALAAGALAQSSSSASSEASSSAAPSSSSAAPSSSSSSSASASSGSSSASGTSSSATTTLPPYDLPSLINSLIGDYGRASVQATPVDEVASQLAGSVTKLYPTVTVAKSIIANQVAESLSASIEGHRNGTVHFDGAIHLGSGAYSAGAFALAAIAGGAFLL